MEGPEEIAAKAKKLYFALKKYFDADLVLAKSSAVPSRSTTDCCCIAENF
jgi:hypothetical protein